MKNAETLRKMLKNAGHSGTFGNNLAILKAKCGGSAEYSGNFCETQ
jgi:hypothetical protein